MADSKVTFKKKCILKRLTMPLSELEDYYREQRKYWLGQGKKLRYIRLRERFYPLFALILKLDRLFKRQTTAVLGKNLKHTGQAIFACTHIDREDPERINEALGRGCWWFVGDPCVLYRDISGLLLYMNGSIFFETSDKTDRHIAYLRALELLKGGGSLMIFPEGARNGTDCLPVMPLFQGTAKMAMETGVKIVPVGIERFDRRFVIKFGKALHPEDYGSQTDLTQALRDALASLKWKIWERERICARSALPKNYGEQFRKEFAKSIYPYDTLETVERSRYHTKEEQEQRDVFADLGKLVPSGGNAFLWKVK